MPLFIRKGINLGPVRLNLSKRGVGVSVGGRGLRAGIDANGRAYRAGGRYGLYYRDQPGGMTFGWVPILILGVGLWWAQSQGWFERFEARPHKHHARAHRAPVEDRVEETDGE